MEQPYCYTSQISSELLSKQFSNHSSKSKKYSTKICSLFNKSYTAAELLLDQLNDDFSRPTASQIARSVCSAFSIGSILAQPSYICLLNTYFSFVLPPLILLAFLVVTFTLTSILATDYIQRRRGQALLFSFEHDLSPNQISK